MLMKGVLSMLKSFVTAAVAVIFFGSGLLAGGHGDRAAARFIAYGEF
jgi:hypothetical protein